MRKTSLLTITLITLTASFSFGDRFSREITTETVNEAFNQPIQAHPRLFLNDQQLKTVLKHIEQDENLKVLHETFLQQADSLINKEPLKRIKQGKRLLSVSREALKRMMLLGWAWRTTADDKYLKRAEQELLSVCSFSDWNPSHYLDVAEMTAAVGIGYDWLYNGLSEQRRQTVRQAIIEKGIEPSLWDKDDADRLTKVRQCWWITTSNNWNQVCHGGLTCGVLAMMEDQPELARKIVHRSVNRVQLAMAEYEPDGAYPEGPGYWEYGTTYNVMLLAALDSALGTDFDLSQKSGFAKSPGYFLNVTGPTGLFFNYPDSGSRGGFCPIVYWFADKYDDPSLTWYQQQLLERTIKRKPSDLTQDRTSVLALLWANPEKVRPQKKPWIGQGRNPVALFRSSWDSDAVFLGIKGGTPSSNHAHMDAGSFVIDADGVRWAVDLGPENYNKIETLGMNLWNGSQNSDRWTIFRYNNTSHNTLVVNDQHQQVKGFAKMVQHSDNEAFPNAVFDMTTIYEGQLNKAKRGGVLLPTGQILIQDELAAGEKQTTVRWAMATPADIDIQSSKKATLTQKGKKMDFEILGDIQTQLEIYSAEPKHDFDAPNRGIQMIGFKISLKPEEKTQFAVLMTPASSQSAVVPLRPLSSWPSQ